MRLIHIDRYQDDDPDILAIHAGPDTSHLFAKLPAARWLQREGIYVLHRDELPKLHLLAKNLGVRIVDNSRRRQTYQPPLFQAPPRRDNQAELNARGIAAARAALHAAIAGQSAADDHDRLGYSSHDVD